MSDKRFVDTNILVYAHDSSAGAKHRRALQLVETLWNEGTGALSTQVLQELCVCLRRKVDPPRTPDEIRQLIRDYTSWSVVVNTPELIVQALDLEYRFKTSFWDALILQAAQYCGATIIYSEDLATGQSYRGIQVVNPLIEP
jgi:predicted nucleic acid-binding protein